MAQCSLYEWWPADGGYPGEHHCHHERKAITNQTKLNNACFGDCTKCWRYEQTYGRRDPSTIPPTRMIYREKKSGGLGTLFIIGFIIWAVIKYLGILQERNDGIV